MSYDIGNIYHDLLEGNFDELETFEDYIKGDAVTWIAKHFYEKKEGWDKGDPVEMLGIAKLAMKVLIDQATSDDDIRDPQRGWCLFSTIRRQVQTLLLNQHENGEA